MSSGAGGFQACSTVLPSTPCYSCVTAHCCSQIDACNADTECLECYLGQAADAGLCTGGATAATVAALTSCTTASCTGMCAATGPACNPVTNAGCEAGALCNAESDTNGNPTYGCYAPPPANIVPVCGVCNVDAGCSPGTTCFTVDNAGQCAAFCCNDGDCGDGGACDVTQGLFGVGVCVTAATIEAGIGAELPSCDVPPVAPSGGNCLNGPAGAPPLDAGG